MKKFIRGSFRVLTILSALFYLLSCLTPVIDPNHFWPITFIALGFPFTAVGFLLLTITWVFIRKKVSLALLIIFLCGFSNIRSDFGFHFSSEFKYKKDSAHLRVITWNVRGFDNNARHAEAPEGTRRQMINYLRTVDADVLLFGEYVEYNNPAIYSNIQAMDSLGYHYYYTTRDFVNHPSWGTTLYGCAIFSKYAIIDSGKVMYKDLPVPESIAYSDIIFNKQRVRLFTTHLISMNLKIPEAPRTDEFYPKYDSAFSLQNPMYKKLIHYDKVHANQARLVSSIISKSPYPVIFSGDLNSVPSSYVYHKIRGNMKDVFIEKGAGFGTTYDTMSSTLRIDCIFVNPLFRVSQCSTPELYLSDHFPVVADIYLTKPKG